MKPEVTAALTQDCLLIFMHLLKKHGKKYSNNTGGIKMCYNCATILNKIITNDTITMKYNVDKRQYIIHLCSVLLSAHYASGTL